MKNAFEKFFETVKKAVSWLREKKWRSIGAALVLFFIICLFFFFGQRPGNKVIVDISPGMSTDSVAMALQKNGVISSELYFRALARFEGLDEKIRAGCYIFYEGMTANEAIKILENGPQLGQVRVTIPEGYTVRQIADILAAKGVVSKADFLEAAKTYAPYDYMKTDNKDVKYSVEGFLFPDTYEFMTNSSPQAVMKVMVEQFNRELTPALRERAKEEHLSIRELVILASLVEAEAKYESDRPIIAQVFFNRLRINMPLQSDTTIQYILPKRKENLSINDTKIASPYNTYIHYGLPPGAVDNPGLASIKAVLYPEANDYLYFVADSEGHNHYSRTYSEHLEVLKQIQ